MTDLIVTPTHALSTPTGLTRDQVDLLKRTICKGATDDELQMFVAQANRLQLDPISKQIHAVKRWSTADSREIMSIQIAIDGFRVVAGRTREYLGQEGPLWCGADGVWKEVWLSDDQPAAAKVGVLRKGFVGPLWRVATWKSYVQTMKGGQPTPFWARMGDVMLAKCAEALALRAAFPQDLSNVYVPEELMQEEVPVARPKVATVTGEVKTKKPEWSAEQTTKASDYRKEVMALAGDAGDVRFKAIWRKMAYDAPDDVLNAFSLLLRDIQEEEPIAITDADKARAAEQAEGKARGEA